MKKSIALSLLVASFTLPGCFEKKEESTEPQTDPVTVGEALQALEESAVSSQASSLTSTSIELTTDFTIGAAAATAAEEIKTFIETQLPCAEITLEGAELSVEYGALPGNCVYKGKEYSGFHRVEVISVAEGNIQIAHEWEDFTDGNVTVTGTADVTWGFDGMLSRQVDHDLVWTRVIGNKSGHDTGSRLQQPHEEGLEVGLAVEGNRSWEGDNGTYSLVEEGVQFRWSDPLPDQGSYTLTLPNDKSLSMSFSRVDADTIMVTVESGNVGFSFNVSKAGAISESEDAQS